MKNILKEYYKPTAPQPEDAEHKMGDKEEIELSVYYDAGRGYWVSVTPVTITQSGAFQVTSQDLFGPNSGFRETLLRVKRSSAKTNGEAIALYRSKKVELLKRYGFEEQPTVAD